MTDAGQMLAMQRGIEPVQQAADCRRVVSQPGRRGLLPLVDGEMRLPPDAGDLSPVPGAAGQWQIVERELDAG